MQQPLPGQPPLPASSAANGDAKGSSGSTGNVLDVAAILTTKGTAAIAAGRGKDGASGSGNKAASGTAGAASDVKAGADAAGDKQKSASGGGDAETTAAAALLASLPTQSMYARNMAKNLVRRWRQLLMLVVLQFVLAFLYQHHPH